MAQEQQKVVYVPMDDMDLCSCGSGKERFELTDARGIFCGYVCDDCVGEMSAKFRPEIFENPNYLCDEPIEPEDY